MFLVGASKKTTGDIKANPLVTSTAGEILVRDDKGFNS